MADVAILHSADKDKAAARLAESVSAAGFAVESVEVEDPSGLADAVGRCGAEAKILIWSRSLVSHALHSGDLARIRKIAGLIEVSADGITPPSGGDESRVVSISGWRGQPFHPGWQRIALELKRLCGARKAVPEAAPPPVPARNPPARAAATAASAAAGRPKGRGLMIGGGAALLLAGAVGASIWIGESAPQPPPRQELRDTGAVPPAAPARRTDRTIDTGPPDALAAPPPAQPAQPAPPPPPSSESPAAAKSEALPEKPASRPAPKPAVRPKPPALTAEPVKKYSRKNSKVMRQFCERSGRSTPQCRTFLRSVRDSE
ncbi:MAG TPA: hypothetical protein VF548_13795 [Allosphingosinicella sp.]